MRFSFPTAQTEKKSLTNWWKALMNLFYRWMTLKAWDVFFYLVCNNNYSFINSFFPMTHAKMFRFVAIMPISYTYSRFQSVDSYGALYLIVVPVFMISCTSKTMKWWGIAWDRKSSNFWVEKRNKWKFICALVKLAMQIFTYTFIETLTLIGL